MLAVRHWQSSVESVGRETLAKDCALYTHLEQTQLVTIILHLNSKQYDDQIIHGGPYSASFGSEYAANRDAHACSD